MKTTKYLQKCASGVSVLAMIGLPHHAGAADVCDAADVKQISLSVNTTAVVRPAVPRELFGFNVPWRDFQLGYVRNGAVRSDLYPYLLPFKGAVYRYPGGSPSNTFEWAKSIGTSTKRVAFTADFNNVSQSLFGVDEFANFVNKLNGRALLTLNISGPVSAPITADAAKTDAINFLNYMRTTSSFKCVAGASCPVLGVELGNELDFGPYNWTASQYVARAGAVVDAVNAAPGLSGINWIAAGRTAPWSSKDMATYNPVVAAGLASKVQGISIHPYYDGIDIPYAMNYVNNFGKHWSAVRPDAKVYVTEHARWPSVPSTGSWSTNWYQATGIGGAISAVDFLMALANQPQVASGNWHALGLSGPWQLIRVNKTTDALYPSPVYWALLTAREAFLDNLVTTKYTVPDKASYSGGYDVKMIGMASTDGSVASVIGINRNPVPYKVVVSWSGTLRKAGTGVLRTVSSADLKADNTDSAPTEVSMLTSSRSVVGGRATSTYCVPAQAVFSIVEP